MSATESITLEVPDHTDALAFYTGAFGLGTEVGARLGSHRRAAFVATAPGPRHRSTPFNAGPPLP
jgi:hypothetical protein